MKAEEIGKVLQQKFGGTVTEVKLDTLDPWATIAPEKLVEVAKFAKESPDLSFDFLRAVAGIDYPQENVIECIYFLFSYRHKHEFKLKVRLPRENPTVATVEGVWPAANWHERETYDLLGVTFQGHSDLRRILLPDDWVGHPLRKDYKEGDSYHGVSTTREYLTGMPELPTHPSQRGNS